MRTVSLCAAWFGSFTSNNFSHDRQLNITKQSLAFVLLPHAWIANHGQCSVGRMLLLELSLVCWGAGILFSQGRRHDTRRERGEQSNKRCSSRSPVVYFVFLFPIICDSSDFNCKANHRRSAHCKSASERNSTTRRKGHGCARHLFGDFVCIRSPSRCSQV
jgi:hypothetical protein